MDQWKDTKDFSQQPLSISPSESRQRTESEVQDPVAARKVQKADREKLRRDRLNEVFIELGNTLDPVRPKNDKATIVADTIQTLRDLTAEVNKLKAECTTLSEESRELTQEKNELRDEKASLKSEVDNLNVQCQQRFSVMYPWGALDPSVVMAPPYAFPVALPMPARTMPIHPSMQPFPFYGNQNPVAVPTPCSTFMPYSSSVNLQIDQASIEYESTSHIPNKQEHIRKSFDTPTGSSDAKDDDSADVVTELELKTPGSTVQQELSSRDTKGKRPQGKMRSCSSSGYSSQDLKKSSSNRVDSVSPDI